MKQGKISMRSNVRCPASSKPSIVLTIVITAMVALFLNGCGSQRKTTKETHQIVANQSQQTERSVQNVVDSASEVVERRTMPVTVPKSEVSLTIPTDSFHNLPPGANYTGRSGQASVAVRRQAATETEPERIYVDATCDSLELACEVYERTIKRLHQDYGEQVNALLLRLSEAEHETELSAARCSLDNWTNLEWFLSGFVSGVVLVNIFNFIKSKRK